MRVDIEISAISADWPIPPIDLRQFAVHVLSHAQARLPVPLATGSEVSVLFSDNSTVRRLNKDYRQKDKSTNVLSFPLQEPFQWRTDAVAAEADMIIPDAPPVLLGDIVLAGGVIREEADRAGLPFKDHIAHLLIHGFLHLLGYDHITDDQAAEMETLEAVILADLAIANPYREELCPS